MSYRYRDTGMYLVLNSKLSHNHIYLGPLSLVVLADIEITNNYILKYLLSGVAFLRDTCKNKQ
jgi:hypothetical protein